MRNPLAIGATTLALALSLGIAACGSSDDSGDSGDTLTNSELIAQADEICTTYNDKLGTLTDEAALDENSSKEEVTAFISDEIVPLYQEQVDALRELQPNEEDADGFNEIITTLDSEVEAVEDDPAAALSMEDPFQGATAKATEFGLEVCGSN